jgi:hypothetical protein
VRRQFINAVFDYIETFYSYRRRRSTLGYRSSTQYEGDTLKLTKHNNNQQLKELHNKLSTKRGTLQTSSADPSGQSSSNRSPGWSHCSCLVAFPSVSRGLEYALALVATPSPPTDGERCEHERQR